MTVAELGRRAKAAAHPLGLASTAAKNTALLTAADLLVERAADVLVANAADLDDAFLLVTSLENQLHEDPSVEPSSPTVAPTGRAWSTFWPAPSSLTRAAPSG